MSTNNENWNRKKKERELRSDVEVWETIIERQNSPHPLTFKYLERVKKNLREFLKGEPHE